MFKRNIIKVLYSTTLKCIKSDNRVFNNLSFKNNFYIVNSCKYLTTKISHVENVANKLSEEEFLVKVKDDPDTFGHQRIETSTFDEGDLKEEEYLENSPDPGQKLRTKQYADIIKALIHKKKIKEAIDVLEVKMLKDDRIKPESYIYNLLLGACGRVGYTKKAFSLYNNMKKRGLKVTGGTYTALFNACANSPWHTDGLSRAQHLKDIMIEKGYEPNDTNYNAMIKAFGRCGDLKTAFSLVDEMQQKKLPVKEDTLNFLLQACISDREAGFRHSLLVWRKFIEKKVQPNVYSYNLLLRCVRDCGLGDIEITENVIDNLILNNNLFLESKNNLLKLKDNSTDSFHNTNTEESEIVENMQTENKPNLIARVPHLGDILSISEITKPEDRLLLVGGYSGFLKNMQDNQCTPNIKTFTQLLDSIPSTIFAERELINTMKKLNIKPDVDFFNMLIKKRSMRFEYDSAKEVLDMMKSAKLKFDIVTYGVLALGCRTKEEAQLLIAQMNIAGYRMNAEILGAMLHQACSKINFSYILEVMEICIREEIQPNKKFMNCLEEFRKKCKNISNDNTSDLAKVKSFQKGFHIFRMRYNTWKEQVNPIDEEEIHPWQQFRQEIKTDVKHYKDREASSRFKARHNSLYRQKKNRILKNDKKSATKKNESNVIDVKIINTV